VEQHNRGDVLELMELFLFLAFLLFFTLANPSVKSLLFSRLLGTTLASVITSNRDPISVVHINGSKTQGEGASIGGNYSAVLQ